MNNEALKNKYMRLLGKSEILSPKSTSLIKDTLLPPTGGVCATYTANGKECSFIYKLLDACLDETKYKKKLHRTDNIERRAFDIGNAKGVEKLILAAYTEGLNLWTPLKADRDAWTWDEDHLTITGSPGRYTGSMGPRLYYPNVINMAIEAGSTELLIATLNDPERPAWEDLVDGSKMFFAPDKYGVILGGGLGRVNTDDNWIMTQYLFNHVSGIGRLALDCSWAIPYFLGAGMPVDIKDDFGNTMLHYASHETTKWLMKNGANTKERNRVGQTFLEAKTLNSYGPGFRDAHLEFNENVCNYIDILCDAGQHSTVNETLARYLYERSVSPTQVHVLGDLKFVIKHAHLIVSAALEDNDLLALISAGSATRLNNGALLHETVKYILDNNKRDDIPDDIWWGLRVNHLASNQGNKRRLVEPPGEKESLAMLPLYAKRMSGVLGNITSDNHGAQKAAIQYFQEFELRTTDTSKCLGALWSRSEMMTLHDSLAWKSSVACAAMETLATTDEKTFNETLGPLVFESHDTIYTRSGANGMSSIIEWRGEKFAARTMLQKDYRDFLPKEVFSDTQSHSGSLLAWANEIDSALPVLLVALSIQHGHLTGMNVGGDVSKLLVSAIEKKIATQNTSVSATSPNAWGLMMSLLKKVNSPMLDHIKKGEEASSRIKRVESLQGKNIRGRAGTKVRV